MIETNLSYPVIFYKNSNKYYYYQFNDSYVLYASEFPVSKALNLRYSSFGGGPEHCEECYNCGSLNGLIVGLCYNCQLEYDREFNTNDLCDCHAYGCAQSLFWEHPCNHINCVYFKYTNPYNISSQDYDNNIIREIKYTYNFKKGTCNKALKKVFLNSKSEKDNYSIRKITRDPLLNNNKYLDNLHTFTKYKNES